MKPLRLGLALAGGQDAREWQRAFSVVERAEALGLHSIWLPEGHFRKGATSSPLVALCAFAARTRVLRLATTSVLLPIHHPLRIAAEVATLDSLSGGRVILGLGRGFQPAVFASFGVSASSKRDRFDESLDAMLRAWSGESFRLDGEHFAANDDRLVRLHLKPVQRPHPPLVVAAFGRKGLLQAARRGLPYLASPLETLDTLAENYEIWREHLASAPALGVGTPVMRTVYVARDDGDARRVLRALSAEKLPLGPKTPPALARAAAGSLEERVLVGTRSAVLDRVAQYRERLGMDLLVARVQVPGTSEAERDACLERLAELFAES